MAPEDLPIFTGTTPKPRFYASEQPPKSTEEKREGRGERGEKKLKTAGTHIFSKNTHDRLAETPRPSGTVSKIQVDIYCLFTSKLVNH